MDKLASKTTQNGIFNQNTAAPATSVSKPKSENNVIKIIQREWEREVERLDAKKNGYKPKQNLGESKQLV